MVGRHDHRLVAADIGLRRQHVHGLGARDARRSLEGESGDALLGHALHRLGIETIENADQHLPGAQQGHFISLRRAHLENEVRTHGFGSGAHDAGPRGDIVVVGKTGRHAGARLQHDGMLAAGKEFLDGFRGRGNARLARPRLGGNADFHWITLKAKGHT